MEKVAGNVGEEKEFMRYLIKVRTPYRLKKTFKGRDDALKLLVMWFFLIVAGSGYIRGKVKSWATKNF